MGTNVDEVGFSCWLFITRYYYIDTKKKEDPRLLDNWRPISLIPVDLKIYCKTLAVRLATVISHVIPYYQYALPGRSIHSALAVIRDSISVNQASKSPLYILALDQMKAFDRVEHSFLFHCLNVIGLPAYMRGALKAVYSGYWCSVKNVSCLSRWFPYGRGIRQGDPLSTFLYSLAIQPFLNALHLVITAQGFAINETSYLITAYADDVTVMTTTPDVLDIVMATASKIGSYSGAKLNISKSCLAGFYISQQQHVQLLSYSSILPVSYQCIKILGINFCTNQNIYHSQWNTMLEVTRNAIAFNIPLLCKQSYLQRAQWATRRLWPRWSYLLKVMQPSKTQIQQLVMVITEAIWLGGKHWISYENLFAPVKEGGLALISPADAIDSYRIIHITKLLKEGSMNPDFALAENIMNHYAAADMGFRILHTRPDPTEITCLSPFYRAAFYACNKIPTTVVPRNRDELLDFPAFNLKFLEQQDLIVSFSCAQAKEKKIKSLRDIIQSNTLSTRGSRQLNNNLKTIIQDWEFESEPDMHSSCTMVLRAAENTLIHFPTHSIFLCFGDIVSHICAWSLKLIRRILCHSYHCIVTDYVPQQTWKILASVPAPAVFKNNFWRFLHHCIPTPTFLHSIGVIPESYCVLCHSGELTLLHQFSTCPSLRKIVSAVSSDITQLGLAPLLDFYQLYPFSTVPHKLANFIVLSYVYTIIVITKSAANTGMVLSEKKIVQIFYDIIAKHLVIHARLYPPSVLDTRFRWLIYTHSDMLASLDGNSLSIRTGRGYKKYNENTKKLI